jgi:hypothetical protein
MPNLVEPHDTNDAEDRKTGISCLAASRQTVTYSQAIRQTAADVIQCANVVCVSRDSTEEW